MDAEVCASEGAGIGETLADLAGGESELWLQVVRESVGGGGRFEESFREHPHLRACDQRDRHSAFTDGSQHAMEDDGRREYPDAAMQRRGYAADSFAEQERFGAEHEDGLAREASGRECGRHNACHVIDGDGADGLLTESDRREEG
jgi:hypothetical protein